MEDACQHFIVQKALSGARKLNPSSDMRLPITVPILEILISRTNYVTQSYYESLLLKAIMSLAFYALLRPGEFTVSANTLLMNSLQLFQDHLEITFFRFKHCEGPPVTISIKKQPGPSCPVKLMKAYVALRGRKHGPIFCYPTREGISYQQFNTWYRSLLLLCNISGKYNGHSFRIGAATLAASRGMTATMIQNMGRWRSTAYSRYIRVPHFTI